MIPAPKVIAAALLVLALAWPANACNERQPWRLQTPLGAFELDPEVRQRLEELRQTLNETARELGDLLREKTALSPEQEERLRRLMERLRDQLRQLEEPEDREGVRHVLRLPRGGCPV